MYEKGQYIVLEKRRVVITGLGTVNPLGNNTADSWAAAKAGKCSMSSVISGFHRMMKIKMMRVTASRTRGF